MKSLEIINDELELAKIQRDKFIDTCMIYNDDLDDDIILYDKRIEKLEEIKQDLKNKKKLEKNFDKLKVKNYDLKNELEKYIKAFKILKDKFKIEVNKSSLDCGIIEGENKIIYLYEVIFKFDRAIYAHDLEKEEHELLENLFNKDNVS